MAPRDRASSYNSTWHETAEWCCALSITTTQRPQRSPDDGALLMSEEMDSPESWEFSRLPFASKILFVTLMCCFCSVPLNHSSVEECASFSVLSQSVNLQSVPHVCVGIREGCGCQVDVNVMIRVRDRVCKLGFQCTCSVIIIRWKGNQRDRCFISHG